MGKEPIVIPANVITQAVKFGDGIVYVSISKTDIPKVKIHAGSISSYSPVAFKLKDCPTKLEDGTVEKVAVSLVLRTMNGKVPKSAPKVVDDDNTI